jgi:hypothetical protein
MCIAFMVIDVGQMSVQQHVCILGQSFGIYVRIFAHFLVMEIVIIL